MNKSALKKFAIEARKELLERVKLQARKIGITADSIQSATVESSDAVFIDGKQLSGVERRQRNKLIKRIEEIGFDRVMDETAYTWFNRFIALRFMEVNDYLPTKVRVLSSYNVDSAEPDMMKEALSLDLELNKEYVYELKMANKTDELFKYLIKVHCNDLNRYMPFMFETIEDYKEILFPEGLLGTDSFVRQMTNPDVMAESDWESVEIIGWLYQYYISEEKDEVFANLKKNIKISKDKVPAATQLFTPNWIVRYMVENSLGRIWMESYPESSLKEQWKYYLDEAEQEEAVKKQLEEVRYKNVNPEEITFLDPCCGSGHILVYAFDVFYEMYLEKGYVENEIPHLILSKNLFGLDVDDRAVQLASFALMMKARGKSRRVIRNAIQPNIYAIQESNWLTEEMIQSIADNNEIKDFLKIIKDGFMNAKEYGSLLEVEVFNYEILEKRINEYVQEEVNLFEFIDREIVEDRMAGLIQQAKVLSKKFDIVCTNPPYMGRGGMNSDLTEYLNKNFPKSKSDLYSSFIEKSFRLTCKSGFISLITMESWMFLSSYKSLREEILKEKTIMTLNHMPYEGRGRTSLGINFGTSAIIFRNTLINNFLNRNMCIRYNEIDDEGVPYRYPVINERYINSRAESFKKIPGNPIAYWLSNVDIFEYEKLDNIFISGGRNKTHNNKKYVRYFWEVASDNNHWVSYLNGGDFKKYYGNDILVVDWSINSQKIYASHGGLINSKFIGKIGLTWNLITSATPGFRVKQKESLYSSGSPTIFNENFECDNYVLGLLNSKVAHYLLQMINPTMNTTVGDVLSLPLIVSEDKDKVNQLVQENIEMAKYDWDSFEISRGFVKHPFLLNSNKGIENAFLLNKEKKEALFHNTKLNEEEINRVFINLYSLETDLDCNLSEEAITISVSSLNKDIKSFISYAVGCLFGRYSLDEEGLIYAGGEFDASRYKYFPADEDNILPILDGAYFEDDIVTKFVDFVRVTFSEETLEENLDFIADAIGRKKSETAREAIRRYFLNDFFKDHVQTYKKHPIYWLFTSGKEKAFNCLIYMHRYDETTLSRIRTDYLHEVQIRMDAEKKDLLSIIEGDYTTKEISDAKKALKSLDKKIDELKAYDELLHHMADQKINIDLDDGVKHNYELFKGLVAKI